MAEQRAELPLVLHVAAGRPDRHVGLAVAQHQRRRQRRARALARLERVRQPLGEPEHLRARAHAEAEAGDDRRAVEPAAARGGGDEVAVAVGDVEVAGVARQADVGSPTPAALDHGRLRRQDGSRPSGAPGRSSSDARSPTSARRCVRVLGAQQRLERHVDEVRVAVPGLAVRERQLRALEHGVRVLARAHRGEVEAREQRELLEHHRALPPRPGLADRVPVVVERDRRLEGRLPAARGRRRSAARPRPRRTSRPPPPPSPRRTPRAPRRSAPRATRPATARAARRCRPAAGCGTAARPRRRQIDLGRCRPLVRSWSSTAAIAAVIPGTTGIPVARVA